MKIFNVLLLFVLFSTVLGKYGKKNRRNKLKNQIKALETSVASKRNEMESSLSALAARVNALEDAEPVQGKPDEDLAWQSLHMAAAAACRGSTASGGSGSWGNAVLAKENNRSCADVCAATEFPICDADVAISGYYGKAESYEQRLGHFYNYGCKTPGNTNVKFDEVKADVGGVFEDMEDGLWYYRFCCCRHD
ncbi:hypothetical protein ACHWQZ_G013777 [Mnemiopsis leidyi]